MSSNTVWAKLTDAVVCVTAVPTTTASFALWNGNAAGGASYVIDSLAWICTTSAAAASMFSMVMCKALLPTASVPATADTATAISAFSGGQGGTYGGTAKTSHTVTVANDIWTPIGNSRETALTATGGFTLDFAVRDMKLILPPLGLLSVAVIAANTTAAGKVTFRWREAQMPVPY